MTAGFGLALLLLLAGSGTPAGLPLPASPAEGADPAAQEPSSGEDPASGGILVEVAPEEAARQLREALKGQDLAAAVEAIRDHGLRPEKEILKLLASGLKHRDALIRYESLRALRYNPSPEASKELLKAARSKKLLADPQAAVEFWMALGQKGDPKAVPLLTKNLVLHGREDEEQARARIRALGRIRHVSAVEALMDLLDAQRVPSSILEISRSLRVLTGAEFLTAEEWRRWWAQNRRGYRVPQEPFRLPGLFQRDWEKLWEVPPSLHPPDPEARPEADPLEVLKGVLDEKEREALERARRRAGEADHGAGGKGGGRKDGSGGGEDSGGDAGGQGRA